MFLSTSHSRVLSSLCLSVALMVASIAMTAPAAATYDLDEVDQLVARVTPAVVRIEVRKSIQNQRLGRRGSPRDLFERFFGPQNPYGRPEQETEPEAEEEEDSGEACGDSDGCARGEGSGMVISSDGYILTAHHVVENVDRILVWFYDGRVVPAELVGSDERSDVALLKVDLDELITVEFGDASALKVGEWLVSIGTPFSNDFSVATGVVSGLNRSVPVAESTYVPFIQTDAAINPGSSGGPLFNLDGQVVGMNSLIFSRSGGSNGVGFARFYRSGG